MLYSKASISKFVPNKNTVYYLRGIADENTLYPIYYIGRTKQGRVKKQLVTEFMNNSWNDIVYINYTECNSEREAKQLEKQELNRFKPKYNFRFVK